MEQEIRDRAQASPEKQVQKKDLNNFLKHTYMKALNMVSSLKTTSDHSAVLESK